MELNKQNSKERISIRNKYKQKKLEKEKKNKKIVRYNEEEFISKFSSIQKKGNARIFELNELLQHNNLNIEFLQYYFDALNKADKHRFKNEIQLYFMTMKLCDKYNIKKEKSEKDRFFELFKKIISFNNSEIDKIISEEYSFPKELESLNFYKEEKVWIYRWGLNGNKIIDFNNIYNEEYFYYAISNYILKNLKDDSEENYYNYISTYKSLKGLIEGVNIYSKSDPDFFEHVFLFLINSQNNDQINTINNIPLYKIFISSMKLELINKEKNNLLNEKEIINKFKENNIKAFIKNNNLHLIGEKINETINNYKNYYITEAFISAIATNIISLEKESLMYYIKFDYLKDSKNYFNGLLYKIIDKYVSSKLSKTSLSKCFNIDIHEFEIIEEEICTNKVHKYIRMIPYSSSNDTGRTLKQFAKILIHPAKQKMMTSFREKTNNKALMKYLEEFINIVVRKYIFEHEHNHLCNLLLFFYYVDKDYEINTPPKKIKDNKIEILKKIRLWKNWRGTDSGRTRRNFWNCDLWKCTKIF